MAKRGRSDRGFPAGISLDIQLVQQELNKGGQDKVRWYRREMKKMRSNFFQVFCEGNLPGLQLVLRFTIMTRNQKIVHLKDAADYMPILPMKRNTVLARLSRGGRSSARETVCRVVAGALAKQALPK